MDGFRGSVRRGLAFCALAFASAWAGRSGSIEADVRAGAGKGEELSAWVNLVALNWKETRGDKEGDRWIVTAALEAESTFAQVMLHEAYVRYKGPLGRWNLSAGRFGLPFGLLPSFVSTRYLFQAPEKSVLGMDADNGVLLSGMSPLFDYSLSVTQGLGAHADLEFPGRGFVAFRLSRPFGGTEEQVVGLSGALGESPSGHMAGMHEERLLAGLDWTGYLGSALFRGLAVASRSAGFSLVSGYFSADYALFPFLEINTAFSSTRYGMMDEGGLFAGLTYRPAWFTLRGGFSYDLHEAEGHEVVVQLYRLFSFAR